jgi:release factor glutamine methyltransferase
VQLRESLAAAIVRLALAHVPSPRLNAELLLRFTLDCDRAYLFAHPERELTPDESARYDSSLTKRGHGMPTQYITGHQEFWGMDFIVTPAVLIPRPETEHLIEAAVDVVRVGGQECPPHRNLRIADVGTGSGCIAVALAKEFPDAEIHATDISAAALEIARANAARLQFENRIQFHESDLLAGIGGPFDFVVSNPPYVGESEEDQVQLEVRKFEPHNAVFAGPTGVEVIARLVPQAHSVLRPGGWLLMEISGTIAQSVLQLLEVRNLARWNHLRIIPDLQSIPRVVVAQKLA